MSVTITIKHALKRFEDNSVVIPDLSLNIKEGEFFTLLGPSGCGKTTLLRMIAGFNTIEGGDFYFNDKRINDMDPAKRNIGMVFQNYAIFPHYTVRKNVEFGLRNDMVIVTSSSVCFRAVVDGEYVVGLTYEDGVAPLLKAGAKNIKMVYPAEGASAFAFGLAVVKGAKNMENAKAMVNYLMSAEGQSYMGNALGTLRFTNKTAKYNSPYLPPDNTIKWVTRDINWLIKNKAQVLEKWNRLYASIKR